MDYNKAIELNPKIAGFYFNRGNAKYNLSNFESSIEDYNKAIELEPTIESAITNRSKAEEKIKNAQTSNK